MVTKFPKSTDYDWIKKMKQENPNQEFEELIPTLFNENNKS